MYCREILSGCCRKFDTTMEVKGAIALLVFLVIVRMSRSAIVSGPYSSFDSGSTSQSSSTVHNVTINCGDSNSLYKKAWPCQRNLSGLIKREGCSWFPHRNSTNNPTDRNITLRDALDRLTNVCYILDTSQKCLEERGISDLLPVDIAGFVSTNGQTVYLHHQRRDENSVHTVQCLYDSRVLAVLYFHIAHRCGGMDILDNVMRRYKNAYFHLLGTKRPQDQVRIPLLYCLPRAVISDCIKGIVRDHCGTMTANAVVTYLVYLQDQFGWALKSAGFSPNICDIDIMSDMIPRSQPISRDHTELLLSRLLEVTTPEPHLGAVSGRFLLAALHSLAGEKLCTTANVYTAYKECVLLSDDKYEKIKFNILQFAHQLLPLSYHGTHCNRLEQFTTCWNLLQDLCGPKVRGLKHHATLMVKGCRIQSEMDNAGCHRQDMLLPHYIQASHVTVWPIVSQCFGNPMSLEDTHNSSCVMDNLDAIMLLLKPGVEEISMKCGSQPANRVRTLLNKLHYLQRDALEYSDLLHKRASAVILN